MRLLLENLQHAQSSFITLTYSDENLTFSEDMKPTLCKDDFQKFMKRLRKYYSPSQIRFYACGEYGSRTKRPHYHAIIFGVFVDKSVLEKIWGFGFVHVGTVTAESIQYVAGYVLKKFVNKKTDTITPEFTLMSRRPGIGFNSVQSYEILACNPYFAKYIDTNGDLPSVLSAGGKKYPLDRYLRFKIFHALELSEHKQFTNFIKSVLLRQREAIEHNMTLHDYEIQKDYQKRLNRETLSKIYNHRSSI